MTVSTLSQEIRKEYDRLLKSVAMIPLVKRVDKIIDGTGGKVSVSDLIAYQIGWGKCLIRWYEAGVRGNMPEMPGEGFSSWNYTAMAEHFYDKYRYDSCDKQIVVFQQTFSNILKIIEVESQSGNLDKEGVWPWCALPSGKQWPLSKWIRVNTVSPYKRARLLISKSRDALVDTR